MATQALAQSEDSDGWGRTVRWDENGSASAWDNSYSFAEFLEVSRIVERWVAGLSVSSAARMHRKYRIFWAHGFSKEILDGQWRYAHITGSQGVIFARDPWDDADPERRKPASP